MVQKEVEDLFSSIKEVHLNISQKKFDLAKAAYQDSLKSYQKIPNPDIKIEKKITETYRKLINSRLDHLKDIKEIKIKKINKNFILLEQYLDNDNYKKAEEVLSNIKPLYATIPNEFMEEKYNVLKKILETNNKIISIEKDSLYNEFEDSILKITFFIERINNYLRNNELQNAVNVYQKIKEIHLTMPHAFIEEKTKIDNKILSVYEKIIEFKEKGSVQVPTLKTSIDILGESKPEIEQRIIDSKKDHIKQLLAIRDYRKVRYHLRELKQIDPNNKFISKVETMLFEDGK